MSMSAQETTIVRWYRNIFSISEIEHTTTVKWGIGALLFAYFTALSRRPNGADMLSAMEGVHTCPPYFQDCSWLYFFQTMPYGYSASLFYMMIFACMAAAVYYMYRKEWLYVQMYMMPIFLYHMVLTLVLSNNFRGNYEYYLIAFGWTLLVLPHKDFFTKLFLVLFYVLSTFTKIHPSWVLGTYFSSMHLGLPLIPDWSIPFWTNMVIAAEMIGAWFLFSSHKLLQRSALVFFVVFHLYSGILVEYRYPSNVLPMLLIMFGPLYRVVEVPLDRKAIAGFALVAVCFMGQISSHLITGDEKLTLEGNQNGLYMFEANHQCQSQAEIHHANETSATRMWQSHNPRNRCDPYREWFRLQQICDRGATKISWQFDHSVNGAPFLRIVDLDDMCVTEYKALEHNTWIKTYKDNPEVIGRPVENFYR